MMTNRKNSPPLTEYDGYGLCLDCRNNIRAGEEHAPGCAVERLFPDYGLRLRERMSEAEARVNGSRGPAQVIPIRRGA